MGRLGVPVTDDARWVFNRLAGGYAARPGYPEPLVHRLLEIAGGRGAKIADLGAGIGHLALPLAALGASVIAVEPARAMLRLLEERCSGRVVAVHAAAEQTGLACGGCDLVLLADALHWVDGERAGREAARILRNGGSLAILEVRLADTPFLRALASLVSGANFKARPSPSGRRAHLFGAAGIRHLVTEQFAHAERLAPDRLDAVLRSHSLVGPALGPRKLATLLSAARRLADTHGGAVWEREISLTWGHR